MRLFDNSAIKIDLFPGKKDRKNAKHKNVAEPKLSREAAPAAYNAVQKVEKEEPRATVKADPKSNAREEPKANVKEAKGVKEVKSMQNMERPTYQRPNTSRSFHHGSTAATLVNHAVSANEHDRLHHGSTAATLVNQAASGNEHDRPSIVHSSEQSNPSRTYQQPWSSPTHATSQSVDAHEKQQQRPTPDHSEPSNTTTDHYVYRDTPATESPTSSSSTNERVTRDQRRSRADMQEEWEADQKLRTNILKGAPHSTNHALKNKRSKADMIRATENMARTLSRSPHRSPAGRRQLGGGVDEVRPGTSSSNGSSKFSHASPSRSTTTNRSLSQSRHMNATNSDSTDEAQQKTQHDGLSPSKLPGVAKKQGKAFHSTIRTSPPLSMEPNKTTWSPTSSIPRRNNHSRTRSGQNTTSTSSAGTNTSSGPSHSPPYGNSNGHVQEPGVQHDGSPKQHRDTRSSVDNKKSDHLSIAQRENLATSEYAKHQPQPVINRSNGKWAPPQHDEQTRDVSANTQTSSDAGRGRSAGDASQTQQQTHNEPATSSHGVNTNSTTANQQSRDGKSKIRSDISYMNYSRPVTNTSTSTSTTTSQPVNHSRSNTVDSSTSTGMTSKSTQSSREVDLAKPAPPPSSNNRKKPTIKAPRSNYVDSGNSTKSPLQPRFGLGGKSAGGPAATTKKEKRTSGLARSQMNANDDHHVVHANNSSGNKFSNGSAVKNNLQNSMRDGSAVAATGGGGGGLSRMESANSTTTTTTTTSSNNNKKKPALTLPVATNKNNSNNTSHGNGNGGGDATNSNRAKVVCINSAGKSTVVPTPATANFAGRGSGMMMNGNSNSNDNNNSRMSGMSNSNGRTSLPRNYVDDDEQEDNYYATPASQEGNEQQQQKVVSINNGGGGGFSPRNTGTGTGGGRRGTMQQQQQQQQYEYDEYDEYGNNRKEKDSIERKDSGQSQGQQNEGDGTVRWDFGVGG